MGDDGVTWKVSPPETVRRWALELAIQSHGPIPGEAADRCFTARAKHFEAYLTGDQESDV